MTCRAAFALAFAATAACEASLGPDGTFRDAGVISDGRPLDAPIDASIDARPCTGGTTAATAPDGTCLVHVTTPVTYAAARTACQQMGAHLAYLKTAPVDTFAQQFVGTFDTWIGGNDLVTEGAFVWEDGSAFGFTSWAAGEPNNAGDSFQEDCVIIAGARETKLWDDRPCDATEVMSSGMFAYLCQY